jgi:uncharacterized cupin superfamily protein
MVYCGVGNSNMLCGRPVYKCDETGVVVEGSFTVDDENGKFTELQAGDSFFVKRGSKAILGSNDKALVIKVAGRYDGEGWGT